MNLPKNIDPEKQVNELFPVFLKLNHLHTLLVGAGTVGLEKLVAIMRNSPKARVTVVSEKVSADLSDFVRDYSTITVHQRTFSADDLNDVDMVVVATNNPDVNQQVRRESRSRRLLVNVADKPELCDFYLGSVVQKGELKLGISTNGKSPTVAKRLKEVLNEALPDELEEVLESLHQIRNKLKGDFATKVQKLNEITRILIDTESQELLNPDH